MADPIDNDFINTPDWSSDEYNISEQELFDKLVWHSYDKPPVEKLKKYLFCFDVDAPEKRAVKFEAARRAQDFVMEQFDEQIYNGFPCTEDLRFMLYIRTD